MMTSMPGRLKKAGIRVTAAWTIATETDTSFRTGKYVKGTVLLVLRKRNETLLGDRSDIYPDVQAEVQRQLKTMLEIDDREDPNFNNADYQLAAYAVALWVVTAYSAIEDIDVEQELKGRDLSGEGFAGSLLRQILFAVYKTAEEDDPRPGLDYLKQDVPNYWYRRQMIVALLHYLSHKPSVAMTNWKKDVEAAHLLLGAVEGELFALNES